MAHLTRTQLIAYAVTGLAVLVLGGRWPAHGSGEEPAPAAAVQAPSDGAQGERERSVSTPSGASVVHVAGAVRRPGVYRLDAGARVKDAVARAGGATGKGDVNAINLAALVQDGAQVLVPRRAPAATGAAMAGGETAAAGGAPPAPVNLNSASLEELQTLDGVGPATAADIVEYRTQNGGFRSIDDLDQVPGIGPKTMEALRDKVVV
ncbi:MAG: helix-hairpin-helix domain-containing protein [Solirubrobacteraceae bacterium]